VGWFLYSSSSSKSSWISTVFELTGLLKLFLWENWLFTKGDPFIKDFYPLDSLLLSYLESAWGEVVAVRCFLLRLLFLVEAIDYCPTLSWIACIWLWFFLWLEVEPIPMDVLGLLSWDFNEFWVNKEGVYFRLGLFSAPNLADLWDEGENTSVFEVCLLLMDLTWPKSIY